MKWHRSLHVAFGVIFWSNMNLCAFFFINIFLIVHHFWKFSWDHFSHPESNFEIRWWENKEGTKSFWQKRNNCPKHKAFSVSSFCWPLQLFWLSFFSSTSKLFFFLLWISISFILILSFHRLANSDHTEDQITGFGTMAFVLLLISHLVYNSKDGIWVWDFTGLHFLKIQLIISLSRIFECRYERYSNPTF